VLTLHVKRRADMAGTCGRRIRDMVHKHNTYLWFMHIGAPRECDTGATTSVNHKILPRSKVDLMA
jgi:hypothetical protein